MSIVAIFHPPFLYSGEWWGSVANNRGLNGNYWSRTANNSDNARNLNFNAENVNPDNNDNNKQNGLTVRCLSLGS